MDNTIYVLDNTQILFLYKNVKCIYVTVSIFFFWQGKGEGWRLYRYICIQKENTFRKAETKMLMVIISEWLNLGWFVKTIFVSYFVIEA